MDDCLSEFHSLFHTGRVRFNFAVSSFSQADVIENFMCSLKSVRGRHSHKHEPIIKESIQRWLCGRRLGRHVVAYTSARLCDGGGGAVYILLRS